MIDDFEIVIPRNDARELAGRAVAAGLAFVCHPSGRRNTVLFCSCGDNREWFRKQRALIRRKRENVVEGLVDDPS